jgi:hypothetical protein
MPFGTLQWYSSNLCLGQRKKDVCLLFDLVGVGGDVVDGQVPCKPQRACPVLTGWAGSFTTKEDKAFQVKETIEYQKEGSIFEDMKKWNPTKHPGHAAAVLKVEEVYSGSKKLL